MGDTGGARVLIIGGSGFVSGTLARAAVAKRHQVWALTRGQRPLPAGVQGLVADRHDSAAMAQAIVAAGDGPWDLVVDTQGFEAADARQDVALFRERARQLVFISSDFVFDPARRRFPQPEETHFYLQGLYGGKKRECELELLQGNTGQLRWTIVRPCHIYGPGSQLGCLPRHGRDPRLIARLRAGEPLQLVGGGHFLQQPIFAPDLAEIILSALGNEAAYGEIFCTAGPDIVESRRYYAIIAELLGVDLKVEEILIDAYRAAHPEDISFLCHRIYSLDKLRSHGLHVPATPIEVGLRLHVESLAGSAPRWAQRCGRGWKWGATRSWRRSWMCTRTSSAST